MPIMDSDQRDPSIDGEPDPAVDRQATADGDGRTDVTASGPLVFGLIVALTALAVGAVVMAHADESWLTVGLLVPVVVAYGVLSIIDAAEQRLPNNITLPLAAISAVTVLIAGIARGSFLDGLGAIGIGLAFAVVLFVMRFGMGDVKMALTVGTIAGWFGANVVITTLFATALSGAAVAIVLLLVLRRRNIAFSYGPFLAIGSVAGMLAAGGLIPGA